MKRKIILGSQSPRRKELLGQIGLEFEVLPSDAEENITEENPADMVIALSKLKAKDVWGKLIQRAEENCKLNEAKSNAEESNVAETNATESNAAETDVAKSDEAESDAAKSLHMIEASGEATGEPEQMKEYLVIGADTVVAIDGEILGKPKDFDDASAMLAKLSGMEHQVYTGVTMIWYDDVGRKEEYSFYVCTGVAMYRIGRAEIMDYVFTGEPMDKAGAYAIQGRGAAFIKSVRGEYSNVVGLPVGRLYQEMKAWDLL